jgi:hypothetical protein
LEKGAASSTAANLAAIARFDLIPIRSSPLTTNLCIAKLI